MAKRFCTNLRWSREDLSQAVADAKQTLMNYEIILNNVAHMFAVKSRIKLSFSRAHYTLLRRTKLTYEVQVPVDLFFRQLYLLRLLAGIAHHTRETPDSAPDNPHSRESRSDEPHQLQAELLKPAFFEYSDVKLWQADLEECWSRAWPSPYFDTNLAAILSACISDLAFYYFGVIECEHFGVQNNPMLVKGIELLNTEEAQRPAASNAVCAWTLPNALETYARYEAGYIRGLNLLSNLRHSGRAVRHHANAIAFRSGHSLCAALWLRNFQTLRNRSSSSHPGASMIAFDVTALGFRAAIRKNSPDLCTYCTDRFLNGWNMAISAIISHSANLEDTKKEIRGEPGNGMDQPHFADLLTLSIPGSTANHIRQLHGVGSLLLLMRRLLDTRTKYGGAVT